MLTLIVAAVSIFSHSWTCLFTVCYRPSKHSAPGWPAHNKTMENFVVTAYVVRLSTTTWRTSFTWVDGDGGHCWSIVGEANLSTAPFLSHQQVWALKPIARSMCRAAQQQKILTQARKIPWFTFLTKARVRINIPFFTGTELIFFLQCKFRICQIIPPTPIQHKPAFYNPPFQHGQTLSTSFLFFFCSAKLCRLHCAVLLHSTAKLCVM